jgi:hypothetical protein
MFSKADFIQKTTAQKLFAIKAIYLCLVPAMISMSAGIYIYYGTEILNIYRRNILILTTILSILIMIFSLILAFRHMKKINLVCPVCNRMIDGNQWKEVLETSKCQKCSGKIID